MNRQDRFAWHYVEACLGELRRDPARAMAKAERNLHLIAYKGIGSRRYVDRWDALLRLPPERLAEMADTDEGQVLRSTAPFAGILPQAEIRRIRKETREGSP